MLSEAHSSTECIPHQGGMPCTKDVCLCVIVDTTYSLYGTKEETPNILKTNKL